MVRQMLLWLFLLPSLAVLGAGCGHACKDLENLDCGTMGTDADKESCRSFKKGALETKNEGTCQVTVDKWSKKAKK